MPKFEILVSKGYQHVSNGHVLVEADTQEEAETKALQYAKDHPEDIIEEGIFEGVEWDVLGYTDEEILYQVEEREELKNDS